MKKDRYLQDIPNELTDVGMQKVLLVRREMIHLKHIRKEIFINRTINIESILDSLGLSLFEYTQFMSNRERQIFKISRDYQLDDINKVVKLQETYGAISRLYSSLKEVIYFTTDILDTHNNSYLYKDSTILEFDIKKILSATQKYKIVILLSSDPEILTTAWCFGIKTFLLSDNDKIAHFSLKTE